MVPCDGLLPVTRGPSPLQPILPCKSLRTSTRLAPGLNDLASTTDSDWLDRAIPHHVEHLVCQPVLFFQHLFLESVCCVVSSLQRDPEGPSQRRRRSSYTSQDEEEAVTPCTRDYVATNGWLSKGRNRLTSGTARNPCFKRLKTHAQRALNAKNGRNRNERDERATPAELPPSVENAAERKGTLKAQAGKQCWHHFSVAPQAVPTQRTHAGRVQ